MLVFDSRDIGNRLFHLRKKAGLTQAEMAEAAGISDRAYANIERGAINMRTETLMKICNALGITPDAILVGDDPRDELQLDDLLTRLKRCPEGNRQTALRLLDTYLRSL